MDHTPRTDLASIASVIGQPARAAMLDALLGGEWLTATELARRAHVARPTASEHLSRLTASGLVARRRSGRHHYFALAGSEIAAMLESLGRLASPNGQPARNSEERALRFARTCYDHLAGELGVLITQKLLERGFVECDGRALTDAGAAWLRAMGVDTEALSASRRTHVRLCLDLSERRDHLAGAVGAALSDLMFARRWIARIEGTRAVRLTLRGREGLYRALDLEIRSMP